MQQEALAALDALPADLISRINAASVAADEDEDTVSYEDIGPLPSARPPPPHALHPDLMRPRQTWCTSWARWRRYLCCGSDIL